MQKHKHKQGHRDDAQAQGNTSIYMGDTKTKAKGIHERHKDKDKRYTWKTQIQRQKIYLRGTKTRTKGIQGIQK